jgi:hypothetical protein
VQEAVGFARLEGVIQLPGGTTQEAAMGFVPLTYAILTVQETIEARVFMKMISEDIWLPFQAFVSAVATFLFMPIVSVLLDPLDCIRPEASSSASSSALAETTGWVMESSTDIVCFGTDHLMLSAASVVMMCIYIGLVLRVKRVGGDLHAIEFSPVKPWRIQDDMPQEGWALHPLAELGDDDVPEDAAEPFDADDDDDDEPFGEEKAAPGDDAKTPSIYLSLIDADTFLKIVNVAVAKLMSSHGSVVAAMVMLTGAYLTATTLHEEPYRKTSVNNGVATIGVTVFFAGCAAEVTTIYPYSQGASVCQSLFGVITALVGA